MRNNVLEHGRLLFSFFTLFSFFCVHGFNVHLSGSHSLVFHLFSHSFIHLRYTHVVHSIFAEAASTLVTSSGKMSLLLIALMQLTLLFRNVISTCSTTSDVEFTFYGYPDGPSDTTSFGCSGTTQVTDGTAGGKSGLLSSPLFPRDTLSC